MEVKHWPKKYFFGWLMMLQMHTLISNLANLISASSGSLGFLHSSVYNLV